MYFVNVVYLSLKCKNQGLNLELFTKNLAIKLFK